MTTSRRRGINATVKSSRFSSKMNKLEHSALDQSHPCLFATNVDALASQHYSPAWVQKYKKIYEAMEYNMHKNATYI